MVSGDTSLPGGRVQTGGLLSEAEAVAREEWRMVGAEGAAEP